MPRTPTKWLIAWYGPEGKLKDALERTLCIRPVKWAQRRCTEGETFQYWNITNPDDEQRIRASLEGKPTHQEYIDYIDHSTGIRLKVEYDIPEHPKLTVSAPEGCTLSPEEVNEVIRRLMSLAGVLPANVT